MTQIILPDGAIAGGKRRGRVYIEAVDLIAYLHKAASEPEQDEGARQFARELALLLEEHFGKHRR